MPEAIKTYSSVNRSDSSVHFGISRMEDVYDKHGGEPDTPHRHNFYTVLVVKSGNGEHRIDFNSYNLGPNQLFFLAPGQVHQLISTDRPTGYSIVFSTDFLIQSNIRLDFVNDVNLFNDYGQSPPLRFEQERFNEVVSLCEQLLQTYDKSISYKWDALGALLKLLLIQSHNVCTRSENFDHDESGNQLLRKFKALIEQHYNEWHQTSVYANALSVTPDHLNRVVKQLSGNNAKSFIQSRILTAAKRHLYFSELSNKEIAYSLGFEEPAYFSTFFKKCTDLSPSDFRESVRKSA